jgi:hypothetical protein
MQEKKFDQFEVVRLISSLFSKYQSLTVKNQIKSYQDFQSQYSESISYQQWNDIFRSGRTLKEITEEIVRVMRTRSLLSKEQEKIKKTKPPKASEKSQRSLLIEASKIIRLKNISNWKKKFGIDAQAWLHLVYEMSKALDKGLTVDEILKQPGFSPAILAKIIQEFSVLQSLHELFLNRIEKSLKSNDADSNTFLNTVISRWGDDAILLCDYFRDWYLKRKKTGRKLNPQVKAKRIKKAFAYLDRTKAGARHSTFYSRDLPTLLCSLSYIAHILIFAYRRIQNWAEFLVFERELHSKDEKIRRLEAIIQIKKLMVEHQISPQELGFEYIDKPLQDIPEIVASTLPPKPY